MTVRRLGEADLSRLLALAAVDMVRSTELLNGAGTDAAIGARRKVDAVCESVCRSGTGRIVDTNGDGTILAFESCTEAIRAANAIQEQMTTIENQSSPAIQVRIGIAVGEVELGTRLIGEAVGEAKRLCDQCVPGHVSVSSLTSQLGVA